MELLPNTAEQTDSQKAGSQEQAPGLSSEILDRVYQAILGQLSISEEHQNNLKGRGITKGDLAKNGYRTLTRGGRTEIAKYLVKEFGEEICAQVPGLYKNNATWRLAGDSGILIPVRNRKGFIQALKIRVDNASGKNKYKYLSAKLYGGRSSGAPIHTPLKAQDEWILVRVTEGELKADIATALSGLPTISIPGVQSWRKAISFLKSEGAKTIRLAFDSDASKNRDVARALFNLYQGLKSDGFQVELETWAACFKGIDDALYGKTKIQVLTDGDARSEIENILRQAEGDGAKAKTEPEEDEEACGRDPEDETKDKNQNRSRLAQLVQVCSVAAYLLSRAENGETLTHQERLRLAHIAKSIGMKLDEIVDLYRKQTNFNEEITRRHVEGIMRFERPPSCKKLAEDLHQCEGTCPAKQASGGWSPAHVLRPDQLRVLPTIQFNCRQMRDVLDDAWRAVESANEPEPTLFSQEGFVVRLVTRKGELVVEHMNDVAMHGHNIRIANWVKWQKKGVVADSPDLSISKDMLTYVSSSLPPIEAVSATPLFGQDGNLITEPGYHRENRLFMDGLRLIEIPAVSANPTQEEIESARSLLLGELLRDFPFAAESDRAHALAMLLLIPARRLIRGVTPLHGVESPSPGTGKGLFIKLVAIIVLGRIPGFHTLPQTEDEVRKKFLSELMKAPPMVVLDNFPANKVVNSDTLASALTSDPVSDRLLGKSKIITVPNKCLWVMSANNPKLNTDIIRRYVRVRIDPKVDKPWERGETQKFLHPDVEAWAAENRAKLLHAILTLIQAWISKECPKPGKHVPAIGSFEAWRDVIGGILEVAGVPDFLKDRADLYESADVQGQEWREFVRVWYANFESAPKLPGELVTLCQEQNLMTQVRGAGNERSQQTQLGTALRDAQDRVFGDLKLIRERSETKGNHGTRYQLIPIPKVRERPAAETESGSAGEPQTRFSQGSPQGSHTKTSGESTTCDESGNLGNLNPKSSEEKNLKDKTTDSRSSKLSSEKTAKGQSSGEGSPGSQKPVTPENRREKSGEPPREPAGNPAETSSKLKPPRSEKRARRASEMDQEDFDAI